MTRRGWAALAVLITGAASALSLGNALYLYIGILLALVFAYSFVTCLWVRLTARCEQRLTEASVSRGEQASLRVRVEHRCPLPVSAMRSVIVYNGLEREFLFPVRRYRAQERRLPLEARHVGIYQAGLKGLSVSDMFGLFQFHVKLNSPSSLTVLPRPFDIEKPRMFLGEEGSAPLARTQEDYSAPEDVRAYRVGDAMKRIHWKLSSRKRELLVRRFETPAPPDTLIILDCDEPQGGENVNEGKEYLRDAMCETAVAVARMQTEDGSPVRLPIYGSQANEFASDHAGSLTLLQEMLAAQPFGGGGEDFARVLNLELRRMRRTGAAVIITTRLDAQIVEGVSHIRRMGPSARLYLVTYSPEAPEYQPYVARLQHHLVEVCYVTPA